MSSVFSWRLSPFFLCVFLHCACTPSAPSLSETSSSSPSSSSPSSSSPSSSSPSSSSPSSPSSLLSQIALSGFQAGKRKEEYKFFSQLMGTRFVITLLGYDEPVARSTAHAAFNEVRRIERQVSSWIPKSEVGQLNTYAGERTVPLSFETYWLLAEGLRLSQLTRGAFDITWAAFKGAWDFRRRQVPTHDVILSKLQHVGAHFLELTPPPSSDHLSSLPPPSWSKDSIKNKDPLKSKDPLKNISSSDLYLGYLRSPYAQIDLGGLAKGYAIDSVARLLKRFGYRDFLINGGGDLYGEGVNVNGAPWSVGVRHPRNDRLLTSAYLPSGWSAVSSGDYERFFIYDNQRYHHIIDLRTGYPAQASVAVTVFAHRATQADAFATGLFILGAREGLALAESTPGLEAIFFTPSGEVKCTQGAQIFTPNLPDRWYMK